VRLWWVMSLGVLLVALYIVITQVATWWSERRLLAHGVTVEATIDRAIDGLNDIAVPDKKMPPNSMVAVSFDWKGRREHPALRQLPENIERGIFVVTGSKIVVHVDPDDPDNWTARTAAPPLASRQLIGVAIAAPIVGVLGLVALFKRRGVLKVWRNGRASAALMVGSSQTPVAPRASGVRCTLADSTDNRVFTVYLPPGAAKPAVGDVVWVIHPGGKLDPAYAAAWFVREKASVKSPAPVSS
jgi:hypothetical protein